MESIKKAFKGDNFDHYVLKTALDTWDSATSHVSSDYSSSNIVLHFPTNTDNNDNWKFESNIYTKENITITLELKEIEKRSRKC